MNNDINSLISLLEKSVSPYHCADEAMRLLKKKGFIELEQSREWKLERGMNYYVKCFGTMLIAFHVGSGYVPGEGFRLAASHTDWPCYYIKPNPEQVGGGCLKLSIEPYGGMIHNTWMDRPLSAAGVVTLRTEDVLKPERRLVDFVKPILTIPNLAIHMNRSVNKGVELNPNKDMLPIACTIEKEFNKDGYFLGRLAELIDAAPEDILSYDLCLYNAEKPMLVGFDDGILTSPRLDNITSTFAILNGICECSREHGITAAVLFDNEEVGSGTKQGADSATLGMMLEKIASCFNATRSEYIDSLTAGFMLSCDVAHAKHPNYQEFADASCSAVMNGGVTLKMNYEQRYATEAVGIGIIEGICKKYDIAYQRYMNRPDLRGGGTLGSYAASQLGMSVADIGVPMLAMHSCRETMGVNDQLSMNELVKHYFNEE